LSGENPSVCHSSFSVGTSPSKKERKKERKERKEGRTQDIGDAALGQRSSCLGTKRLFPPHGQCSQSPLLSSDGEEAMQ